MVARAKVNIADVARRAQRKVQTVANEVTQDLAETVIERTPVGPTGFLRGSWFVSLNDRRAAFEGKRDKNGAQTVSRVSLAINDARIGDSIVILNSASYAPFVEQGTFKMRPRRFVRRTVDDAPDIAEETIRRIGKR